MAKTKRINRNFYDIVEKAKWFVMQIVKLLKNLFQIVDYLGKILRLLIVDEK